MKKPITIEIAGKTEDGKLVIKNLYQIVDRMGLPLEDAIFSVRSQGFEIDWMDYIKTGLSFGNNPERLIEKIRNSLIDCEEDYKKAIDKFLDDYTRT